MTRKALLIAFGITAVLLFTGTLSGFLLSLPAVSDEAIQSAYRAVSKYRSSHPHDAAPQHLAIVDYTKPSFFKRMVIIDMNIGSKSFYRVAHAAKSGTLEARRFSNISGSNMSSLGLYKTGNVYRGDHGLAIRLHGLDSLKNSNAFPRDIVLHSADYVSIPVIIENLLTFNGPRIGRSNGCFVVTPSKIEEVVDKLGRGGFIYAHGEAEHFNTEIVGSKKNDRLE
ncbi:murein L,D-transpeptidase catalytic domain family protein [Prosthecochloris sp. SCSIO W1103]|uniref:murein L,D-transpeptidase catalytic domain family protein n=1 Tax=Prosthecochloris sp. SCSIO W1103 TaxID=2992244 RepID=UPI00223E2B6B|nr:murein L,D-transpeptidase catalytic domain family protein [Prosthecochloris sp. SCSIO W1103]UZJ38264.1 murein L,D-transpeptidase catalytic domain family protein [Prosthecochloris sp. SCSIO W1103]